jgi:hypothetical protein
VRRAICILLGCLFLLALPQAAAADECSVPASGYDRGGSPGSGPANDPLFARQWALTTINAPVAWDARALAGFPSGGGPVVGIVDSGVRTTHVQNLLSEKVTTPLKRPPRIDVEEVDGDQVVMRVTATPVTAADGAQLADEVLAAVGQVTHQEEPAED